MKEEINYSKTQADEHLTEKLFTETEEDEKIVEKQMKQ